VVSDRDKKFGRGQRIAALHWIWCRHCQADDSGAVGAVLVVEIITCKYIKINKLNHHVKPI
jgi:hypothetical protein